MEKWSHLVHLGEKNVGLCLYIPIYTHAHTIYVFIYSSDFTYPKWTPQRCQGFYEPSLSSRFFRRSFQVCQPNPCKLLPGTPLSVLQIMLSLEFLLLLVCLNHVAGDGRSSLWNENSIGEYSPPKKCVSLGNPFFLLAMPILHPMQKGQQRCSTKVSSQWNLRPP